jgi:hypothetical protein
MLRNGDVEEGAKNFGVSVDLFRWRVNHTGVARQIAARRRYTPR